MTPLDPLQYPAHYPPSDRWQRFFIGVRRLGPDLSFFRELHAAQAARTPDAMNAWGGGQRQALATTIGVVLSRYCNWPGPFFLPDDSFSVIAGGSSFGWLDEADVDSAIRALEELSGASMPSGFWDAAASSNLADVVDQLMAAARRPPAGESPHPQGAE